MKRKCVQPYLYVALLQTHLSVFSPNYTVERQECGTNPLIQRLYFLEKKWHRRESFDWKTTLSGSNITAHSIIPATAAKRNLPLPQLVLTHTIVQPIFYYNRILSNPAQACILLCFGGKQLESLTYCILWGLTFGMFTAALTAVWKGEPRSGL